MASYFEIEPMRAVALTCAMCAGLTGGLAAQGAAVPADLERGSTGIGSHLRLFLSGKSNLRSGVEVGYSRIGRVEGEWSIGARGFSSVREINTSSTRLWHATVIAKRQWPSVPRFARAYAVAGTGLYLVRASTESFRYDALTNDLIDSGKTSRRSWEFGANVGAGVELNQSYWPGTVDLDARLHLLPFSDVSGPRTLFTVAVGLSFF